MTRHIISAFVIGGALVGAIWFYSVQEASPTGGGESFTADLKTASSTTYTLTTTSSQRLLATSSARTSASIQPRFCTAGGTVFLNFEQDVAATVANSDFIARASTTELLSLENGNPVPFESVTGILDAGTCTVVVTEWVNR